MDPTHIVIPLWGSLQNIYRQEFEAKVCKYLLGRKKIKGDVSIKMVYTCKGKGEADLCNILSLVVDSIKRSLIEDEKKILRLTADRIDNMPEDKLDITIYPLC